MITEWLIRHSNLDDYQGRKRELARFGIRIFITVLVLGSIGLAHLAVNNATIVEFVSNR